MPEKPTPTPKPRPKKRRWYWRLVRGFLWLLLILVLFHRPLVHYGGRWLAIHLAKQEHLNLDLKIRGNLWGHLEITEIHAAADGTGPAPLESLSLDRVAVDYDVMKLISGDLNGLRAVEIGTVDAVIPEPKEPPKPTPNPTPLAETLRSLLKKPLPAPRFVLTRLDLRVKQTGGDIVAKNFRLSLLPGTPGVFGWDRLEIPGLAPFESYVAATTFGPGNLRVEQKENSAKDTIVTLLATPPGGAPSMASAPGSSPPATPAGNIQVDVQLLGLRLHAFVAPAASGLDLKSEVSIENVDVPRVAASVGVKIPVAAQIPRIDVAFDGDPDRPDSWVARVALAARVAGPGQPAGPTPAGATVPATPLELLAGAETKLSASLRKQTLTLDELTATAVGARFSAKGAIPIPPALLKGDLNGADTLPKLESGAIDFSLEVPDLAAIGKLVQQPLGGKALGTGRIAIDQSTARLSFDLTGDGLASPPMSVTKTSLKLRAAQSLRTPDSLRNLQATAELHLQNAGTKEMQAETVSLTADFHDLHATLQEVKVERGKSTVIASGSATMDERGKFTTAPTGKFSLLVPALADFQLAVQGQPLSGSVSGDGEFVLGEPPTASTGKVYLKGTGVRLGDAEVGEFEIEANAANGTVTAQKVALRLPGQTTLDVTGKVGIAEPHAYTGKVSLQAPDLAAFQKLLDLLGQKKPVGGHVTLEVEGSGDLAHPTASVRLDAKDVRYDTTQISEARFAGKLTPDSAETTELTATMGKLRVGAQLNWKDRRAAISGVELQLDGVSMLTGTLSAPFDPRGAIPLPADQPLQANLIAKDLDVGKILAQLGRPAPVAGTLSVNLQAGGTLAQPSLKLDVIGKQLRTTNPPPTSDTAKAKSSTIVQPSPQAKAPAAPDLPPTDLETHVTLTGSELKVAGIVKQPLVQPLTFSAGTTFALQPLLEGRPFDYKTLPLSASVDLPASQLAFVPRLVPAVAKLEGTAAIAVRAKGTFGKPELEGTTTLDLKLVRLANGAAPLVTNFKGRLAFAGDRLTFPEFGGELGGGKFSMKGSIGLAKPAEPEFDLSFSSKDVLLLRDDSILMRADADVALKGPLKAATASGTVYVVSSRFNKEIDILPLALPGKPKPIPRVAAQPATISFPDPPLRDWKFDIAVKTRPEGPFLVRGNLAKGRVSVDVRLGGTGLHPFLTGAASIEEFSATLPLSTLRTRRGLVTFSEDSPFQPVVELEAETVIRQYTVIARVNGPATKPQLDLESEPPLPQQEILSLLTTGSLTGEIGANNTALATRAAILVVKSWYKKIFKKDVPLNEDDGGQSLLDRFEVDFGAVDPKTGRNETTAQVRLTDRFFLIGDLEMGGGFSGRVKYVLKFK